MSTEPDPADRKDWRTRMSNIPNAAWLFVLLLAAIALIIFIIQNVSVN